jgi:sugar lactone lactonase YvrE
MTLRRPVFLVVLGLASLLALTASATQRSLDDVRVFAHVGFPGQPEPIAIGPDGYVYVGTNQENRGIGSRVPSRIFVYDRHGRVVRQEVIRGQDLSRSHGIIGLIFDGSGLLYVLDRSTPARVIRLDPTTGKQTTFATFSDVPLCSAGRISDCSYTPTDAPPGPDVGSFAPDGTLYVTDLEQGLIWKVPRRGGHAKVWFTDPRLVLLYINKATY